MIPTLQLGQLGISRRQSASNNLPSIYAPYASLTYGYFWQDHDTTPRFWTDTGRATPAVTGDAVACADDVGPLGIHLYQATGTKQPILRKLGGYYCLEFDQVDDLMESSSTITLSVPVYLSACVRRDTNSVNRVFGAQASAASYVHLVDTAISDRCRLQLRDTSAGLLTISEPASSWPTGSVDVHDSLSVVGTSDIQHNKAGVTTAANAWTSSSGGSGQTIRFGYLSGGPCGARYIFGAVLGLFDPAADRNAMITVMGNQGGLSL